MALPSRARSSAAATMPAPRAIGGAGNGEAAFAGIDRAPRRHRLCADRPGRLACPGQGGDRRRDRQGAAPAGHGPDQVSADPLIPQCEASPSSPRKAMPRARACRGLFVTCMTASRWRRDLPPPCCWHGTKPSGSVVDQNRSSIAPGDPGNPLWRLRTERTRCRIRGRRLPPCGRPGVGVLASRRGSCRYFPQGPSAAARRKGRKQMRRPPTGRPPPDRGEAS